MRKIWIFLWCMSMSMAAVAGAGDSLSESRLAMDTAGVIDARTFSAEGLDHYRTAKDFQYERATGEVLSWWDRLKRWFWDMVDRLFHYTIETPVGRAIMIFCIVLLIIYAVLKMTGADKGWFFEKDGDQGNPFYINEEEVNAIDFERAIAEAVDRDNYRLAIRLWYLMTLKKLADKGLIHWKPGKTNYEYIRELRGSPYADTFVRLTNSFEFFWYGEARLQPSEYERVKDRFSTFNKQFS